jgi:hypothetical protein
VLARNRSNTTMATTTTGKHISEDWHSTHFASDATEKLLCGRTACAVIRDSAGPSIIRDSAGPSIIRDRDVSSTVQFSDVSPSSNSESWVTDADVISTTSTAISLSPLLASYRSTAHAASVLQLNRTRCPLSMATPRLILLNKTKTNALETGHDLLFCD